MASLWQREIALAVVEVLSFDRHLSVEMSFHTQKASERVLIVFQTAKSWTLSYLVLTVTIALMLSLKDQAGSLR